jgi:ABC-type Mn2+/Zn2+ transport system ATPase subunit
MTATTDRMAPRKSDRSDLHAPPAVEAADVHVTYAVGAPPALDGVSISVAPGQRVGLLGANGAGKSTLLKSIVGLVPLQSGSIRIDGATLGERRKRVAYLAQQSELDWRFPISVQRFVMTGRYVHLGWLRRPGRNDAQQALDALSRLGIGSLANRQIGQLSGGQRQRVLLARALVQHADILLLDEPFTAVDAESREILTSVLEELHRAGATQIISTHEVGSLELDDAVYLHNGRVLSLAERDAAYRQLFAWTG